MSNDLSLNPERNFWTKSFFLSTVMLSGVIPYFFSDTDGPRGIAVAAATGVALVYFLFVPNGIMSASAHPTILSSVSCLLFMGIIGHASLRGLQLGNDRYYLSVDLYHWLVELFAVALVTRIACLGTAESSLRILLTACLVTISATGVLVIGCYAGLVEGGGYFQGDSRLWHLKAGVNHPQIPLMIALCAAIYGTKRNSGWRAVAWATVFIATLLLFITLKRTMWLSTVASLTCVLLPSRFLRNLALLGVIGAIGATTFIILYKSERFSSLDFLTYNEGYRITDTIEDRQNQLADTLKLIDIAGKGFGAEVDIYKVGTNEVDRLHHVHSLYVFELLQLGVPLASLIFIYLCVLLFLLNGLSMDSQKSDWRIPAALACLVGLCLNGVTLVSMHSAFSGVAFGLALAANGDHWKKAFYVSEADSEDGP